MYYSHPGEFSINVRFESDYYPISTHMLSNIEWYKLGHDVAQFENKREHFIRQVMTVIPEARASNETDLFTIKDILEDTEINIDYKHRKALLKAVESLLDWVEGISNNLLAHVRP